MYVSRGPRAAATPRSGGLSRFALAGVADASRGGERVVHKGVLSLILLWPLACTSPSSSSAGADASGGSGPSGRDAGASGSGAGRNTQSEAGAVRDAALPHAGATPDGAAADGAARDGAAPDGAAPDGAAACAEDDACEPRCSEEVVLPLLSEPPATLVETGMPLDADAPYLQLFEPVYPLWSDGSDKRRWIYLPPCTQIDTTAMDDWKFPAGTRVWKEFSRDGKRIETRLIHKKGPGVGDWLYAAYIWNEAGTEATLVGDNGLENVHDSSHDIPSLKQCGDCHSVLSQRVLGFSAVQLSHGAAQHETEGATMRSLSESGLLTSPAPDGFAVPGDALTQRALGYLHSNCGNCHNSRQSGALDMRLRLRVGELEPEDTDTYTTTLGLGTSEFECEDCLRVAPGAPERSALLLRMQTREEDVGMPPLGTEELHDEGIAAVRDWILQLEP